MPEATQRDFPIPSRLNVLLLVMASTASATLLFLASHTERYFVLAACAIAFSFTGNTLFSLLHEAVHGVFSANRTVNDWGGRVASIFFPTGFSIQRAYHHTHHNNNRSPLEQFDVIHQGDLKWLKYAQWYAILTGVYWIVAVIGSIAYLLVPRVLRTRLLREKTSRVSEQTSSRAYLEALDKLDPVRARLEIVFSFVLQFALVAALDLSLAGWAACYGAFALNWSALQYADHAFSPLDAHEGAWNLQVGPVGRLFFLDYHLHRTHHQNPRVPWIHLRSLSDPDEPRPSFFRVWFEMFRGPRALTDFPSLKQLALPRREQFLAFPMASDAWIIGCAAAGFGLLFLLFYGGASVLGATIPWRVEVALPFESLIPFVPAASWLYLSLQLLLALTPFVLRRWTETIPLFAALVLQTLVATLFFLAMPVQTTFPERHVEGMTGIIFGIADTLNLEGNFFPSLHVAFAVTAALAFARKARAPGRFLLFAWAAAIALSTLLIHEHHLLDVIAGLALALWTWPVANRWGRRSEIISFIDIELICARNFLLFGRRHPRYWLIALALWRASLPRWRSRRLLRTGFCFLQSVDDLLDGDRPSQREPLLVVRELASAIKVKNFGDDEMMRLARAFITDLCPAGGNPAVADALALMEVMCRDRRRVLDKTMLTRLELKLHHRETFTLSIDLMLLAGRAELRAANVPELIDAFGWCSTMRDLKADLQFGLINIPKEVLEEAQFPGIASFNYEALVGSDAVRAWLQEELVHAQGLLDKTDERLEALAGRPGVSVLKMFAKSIRTFSKKRFARRFPNLQPLVRREV